MSTTTHPEEHVLVTRVPVHDRAGWLGRGLYFDVLALVVNLLAGIALAVDLYAAGVLRSATTVTVVGSANFAPLARLGLELAVFILSFAWIAGRLVRAAYQEIPQAR